MKPGWFETPKKSAVECCERSDKCRQHAEESSAPLGKVHWLRLSEEWLQLAEEADRKREERASASIPFLWRPRFRPGAPAGGRAAVSGGRGVHRRGASGGEAPA